MEALKVYVESSEYIGDTYGCPITHLFVYLSSSCQRTSESGHLPANPLRSSHPVDQTARPRLHGDLALYSGQGPATRHLVRGAGLAHSPTFGLDL